MRQIYKNLRFRQAPRPLLCRKSRQAAPGLWRRAGAGEELPPGAERDEDGRPAPHGGVSAWSCTTARRELRTCKKRVGQLVGVKLPDSSRPVGAGREKVVPPPRSPRDRGACRAARRRSVVANFQRAVAVCPLLRASTHSCASSSVCTMNEAVPSSVFVVDGPMMHPPRTRRAGRLKTKSSP